MWFEPSRFPFTARLAASWLEIKHEVHRMDPHRFKPWGQTYMYDRPGGWQVLPLYASEIYPAIQDELASNRELCPRTCELLTTIPGLESAGFSVLLPKTSIPSHTGVEKGCVRGHLGIMVPDGATIEVAGEQRRFEDGRWLVFDDTALHAASNPTDIARVNLVVDFKRATYGIPDPPGLSKNGAAD